MVQQIGVCLVAGIDASNDFFRRLSQAQELRSRLLINLFKSWQIPVILVARTALGTINHTLLSLEALWSREIPVHGIIFVGDKNEDNMRTIHEFSDTKILGCLPMLDSLNTESLASAFDRNFKLEDFVS